MLRTNLLTHPLLTLGAQIAELICEKKVKAIQADKDLDDKKKRKKISTVRQRTRVTAKEGTIKEKERDRETKRKKEKGRRCDEISSHTFIVAAYHGRKGQDAVGGVMHYVSTWKNASPSLRDLVNE